MRLEQRRWESHSSMVEDMRERTEPCSAHGRVRHGAGTAHGKSCMDTGECIDLGVRTEHWDRGLERCRKFQLWIGRVVSNLVWMQMLRAAHWTLGLLRCLPDTFHGTFCDYF